MPSYAKLQTPIPKLNPTDKRAISDWLIGLRAASGSSFASSFAPHVSRHRHTLAHTGTHWRELAHFSILPSDSWLSKGLLEDDVLTLPVSGAAHHASKVGLLPSKVRLLSKVLLEAKPLLAFYVLVNA